jgi:hypothetical protein
MILSSYSSCWPTICGSALVPHHYSGRKTPGAEVAMVRGGSVSFCVVGGDGEFASSVRAPPETGFSVGSLRKKTGVCLFT